MILRSTLLHSTIRDTTVHSGLVQYTDQSSPHQSTIHLCSWYRLTSEHGSVYGPLHFHSPQSSTFPVLGSGPRSPQVYYSTNESTLFQSFMHSSSWSTIVPWSTLSSLWSTSSYGLLQPTVHSSPYSSPRCTSVLRSTPATVHGAWPTPVHALDHSSPQSTPVISEVKLRNCQYKTSKKYKFIWLKICF